MEHNFLSGLLADFITNKVKGYYEPSRKELPKGHTIGFMAPKYLCALLSLTDNKPKYIAECAKVNYVLMRRWRTEPAFKELVAELAEEFAGVFWAAFGKIWKERTAAYDLGTSPPSAFDSIGDTESWGDVVILAIFNNKPAWVTKSQGHTAVTMIARKKDKVDEKINAVNEQMRREYHADCIRIMQSPTISDDDRLYVLHYLQTTNPLP